jgi:ribosomal protein S27AE
VSAACPRCQHPSLEATHAKVVDPVSVRIVQVVACSRCEFIEELAVIIGGEHHKRA